MTRFEDEQLLHALFVTKQSIKICNAITNTKHAKTNFPKEEQQYYK